jgi:hypothetical protein
MRLSPSHNTLTLGDTSSSTPAGPFAWSRSTDGVLETWQGDHAVMYARGSHGGLHPSGGCRHVREVLQLRGAGWLIRDRVVGPATDTAVVHFHSGIGGVATLRAPDAVELCQGTVRLGLRFAGVDQLTIDEDWVSPLYGRRERAPVIRASLAAPRLDALTLLVPVPSAGVPARMEAQRSGNGWMVSVHGDQGIWRVKFGPGLATEELFGTDAPVALDASLLLEGGEVSHSLTIGYVDHNRSTLLPGEQ